MSDLKAENETLRLLVAGLTIAVDMEPSADPLEEPWVRLVEAAHKHGRRLERAAIAADLRARASGLVEPEEWSLLTALADRYERGEHEEAT